MADICKVSLKGILKSKRLNSTYLKSLRDPIRLLSEIVPSEPEMGSPESFT